MYEFGVGHEKNVIVKEYLLHLEFKLWVRFLKGLKRFFDLFVDIFFHMFQKQEPAYSQPMGGINVNDNVFFSQTVLFKELNALLSTWRLVGDINFRAYFASDFGQDQL